MNRVLKMTALGGVLFVGGCTGQSTTAPDSSGDTAVITSPAKPTLSSEELKRRSTVHTYSTKMNVASLPQEIRAGESVELMLQIVDNKTDEPVQEFEAVHGEKLHLVVVSNDLSWFSHVHPEYMSNGQFRITTTLPRAGKYRLYADYKPQGKEGEVALQEFTVRGENPFPDTANLAADEIVDTWIVKQAKAAPKGKEPAANAREYQVALMPMPEVFEVGKTVTLHFQVRDASGKPVQNLQPYLGAMGHSIALDTDAQTYIHAHPSDDDAHDDHGDHAEHGDHGQDHDHETGSADVMFNTAFPHAGLYRVWGQFQHNGEIITASFDINVEAARQARTSSRTQLVAQPVNGKKLAIAWANSYQRIN